MQRTPRIAFAAPEDAYHEFFRADSAQDANAWAAVMSYPHVRVSARGQTAYYQTAEEYAARASWTQREATGWVRSVGVAPTRLHESSDKVHLLGGWTRYNAADEPILENRVTYTCTRVGSSHGATATGSDASGQSRSSVGAAAPTRRSWGIQARFGTDSFVQGETYEMVGAIDAVAGHLQAWRDGDLDAAAASCRFPFIEVGIGAVDTLRTPAEFAAALRPQVAPGTVAEVTVAQAGRVGAVVAAEWHDADGRRMRAVFVVGERDGRWRVGGRSAIRD